MRGAVAPAVKFASGNAKDEDAAAAAEEEEDEEEDEGATEVLSADRDAAMSRSSEALLLRELLPLPLP